MKKTIIYITAAVLAASCIYPFNPDINTETGRDLVVDGKIVLGGTSTVSLSYIADLNRTKESSIRPKGKAWIEDSAGNKYESDNNALTDKISINTTALPKGLQYRTVVSLDGDIYSSEWLDAEAPPVINRIFFEPDQNYVHVSVNVSVPESRSGYMGFSFEECWEFHSDFIPEFVVNTQTWSYAPLMGTWKFYWQMGVENLPKDFYKDEFDFSAWADMPVPSVWQNHGSDRHQYTNVRYPISGFKVGDPMVEPPKWFTSYTFRNPVGLYSRTFSVPS